MDKALYGPTLKSTLSSGHATTDLDPKKIWGLESPERQQISMIDISRAYSNAKTNEDDPVYVDSSPGLGAPVGTCGLLRRHMKVTRRAAEGGQDEYSSGLRDVGFRHGSASACIFRHEERRIAVIVHGDDFTVSGPKSSLDWYVGEMQKRYD